MSQGASFFSSARAKAKGHLFALLQPAAHEEQAGTPTMHGTLIRLLMRPPLPHIPVHSNPLSDPPQPVRAGKDGTGKFGTTAWALICCLEKIGFGTLLGVPDLLVPAHVLLSQLLCL